MNYFGTYSEAGFSFTKSSPSRMANTDIPTMPHTLSLQVSMLDASASLSRVSRAAGEKRTSDAGRRT